MRGDATGESNPSLAMAAEHANGSNDGLGSPSRYIIIVLGYLRWRRASSLQQLANSLGLLVLLLTYITSFWGRAGFLLPSPLDNWHHVFFRGFMRSSESAQLLLSTGNNLTLYVGVEALVLGLIVPATLLSIYWRRSLFDLGLRWPNSVGWRWTMVSVASSVPVGLWITGLVPPSGSDLAYVVRLLVMLPEHFLICGVAVALLLPGRSLSGPSQIVSADNLGLRPVLGRLHATLPRSPHAQVSLLGWLGLCPASLFAIVASATIFVAAHVGARSAELAFSVPMGIFCAYMTWRTGSIWPALLTHWSLNLAPLGLRALFL